MFLKCGHRTISIVCVTPILFYRIKIIEVTGITKTRTMKRIHQFIRQTKINFKIIYEIEHSIIVGYK